MLQNLQITTLRDEFDQARREIMDSAPEGIELQMPPQRQEQIAQLRTDIDNLQLLTAEQQELIQQQINTAQHNLEGTLPDGGQNPMMGNVNQMDSAGNYDVQDMDGESPTKPY